VSDREIHALVGGGRRRRTRIRPGVVVIDDAEVLRDCDAAEKLEELIAFGGGQGQRRPAPGSEYEPA